MNAPEEDDSLRPGAALYALFRKAMFILGLCLLLWIVLTRSNPAPSPRIPPGAAPEAAGNAALPPRRRRAPENASQPPPEEPPAPAAQPAEMLALRQQLERLEEKITALAATPATLPEADRERLEQTTQRLTRLEAGIAAMGARIEERDGQSRLLAAAIALGALKEAAVRGEPFDAPLKRLAPLLPGEQAEALLAALEPLAAKGLPTLASLQSRFGALLPEALSAGQKEGSLKSNLQSLIRIRKVGERHQGEDAEAILARAEAKMAQGDVAAALREMAALPAPASDVMAEWVKAAEAFLAGRRAIDALQLAILASPPAPENE